MEKYMTDFLGKKFPKDKDSDAIKVQVLVLVVAWPLASGWQNTDVLAHSRWGLKESLFTLCEGG